MPLNASETLNREYLEMRAKILELAASLDRLDRQDGSVAGDPRMDQIAQGFQILLGGELNRAEQVQQLFSLSYDANWRESYQIS